MKEVNIYMTDRQIDQVKKYAVIHKVSFNEVIRIAVNELFRSERKEEIECLQKKTLKTN